MIKSNTTHHTQHLNLSYITIIHKKTHFFHKKLILLPFNIKFKILTTTILTKIPLTKYTKNNPNTTIINNLQKKFITTYQHLSLSKKQKIFITIITTILNIPSLFYIFIYPTTYSNNILNNTNINI